MIANRAIPHLTPSRNALWLNWHAARDGKTEFTREYGRAMINWIMTYHPELEVRQTAYGMLKFLEKRGENGTRLEFRKKD